MRPEVKNRLTGATLHASLCGNQSPRYYHLMSSTGVPIWVPLLVALIGTLSTIAGVWISSHSARTVSNNSDERTSELEKEKFIRDEVRATNKELRDAAGAFLAEAREYIHGVQDNYQVIADGPLERGQKYLERNSQRRIDFKPVYATYWQIAFISREPVSSAAKSLLEATRAFDYQYIEGSDMGALSETSFEQLRTKHIAARSSFYAKVKAGLDTRPGVD